MNGSRSGSRPRSRESAAARRARERRARLVVALGAVFVAAVALAVFFGISSASDDSTPLETLAPPTSAPVDTGAPATDPPSTDVPPTEVPTTTAAPVTTTEAPPTTSAPAPADQGTIADGAFPISAEIRDGTPAGGVRSYLVEVGTLVQIDVTADGDYEVHLHGYDLESQVSAGRTATILFTATQAGSFEFEVHDTGELMFYLDVV